METGSSCGITNQPCIYARYELENCRYCFRFQSILCDSNNQNHERLLKLLRKE